MNDIQVYSRLSIKCKDCGADITDIEFNDIDNILEVGHCEYCYKKTREV